jgi:hypothetical protein
MELGAVDCAIAGTDIPAKQKIYGVQRYANFSRKKILLALFYVATIGNYTAFMILYSDRWQYSQSCHYMPPILYG